MFHFEKKSFDLRLQPYITAYWEYERYEEIVVFEPLPAVAVMHLQFHLGNPSVAVIDGKHLKSSKIMFAGILPTAGNYIKPHGYHMIYGITITPLGLWRLFGVRGIDCLNGFIDYFDVCKDSPPDLISTPPGVEGAELRFHLVNEWCINLLNHKNDALSNIEKFTHNISHHKGAVKIHSQIEVGSTRQMQRRFKEMLGISPKSYACLLRFNTVLALLAARPGVSLLEAALQTGYNDASHLCHDFKKLGVQLPREWVNSPSDHTASLISSLL